MGVVVATAECQNEAGVRVVEFSSSDNDFPEDGVELWIGMGNPAAGHPEEPIAIAHMREMLALTRLRRVVNPQTRSWSGISFA